MPSPTLATAETGYLQNLLRNPSQNLVDKDIELNRLLGGGNETLSARVGKAKDESSLANLLAMWLNSIDPGHTKRAVTAQYVNESPSLADIYNRYNK